MQISRNCCLLCCQIPVALQEAKDGNGKAQQVCVTQPSFSSCVLHWHSQMHVVHLSQKSTWNAFLISHWYDPETGSTESQMAQLYVENYVLTVFSLLGGRDRVIHQHSLPPTSMICRPAVRLASDQNCSRLVLTELRLIGTAS